LGSIALQCLFVTGKRSAFACAPCKTPPSQAEPAKEAQDHDSHHRHHRPRNSRQPRQPTVEVDVVLEDGSIGRAAVPSVPPPARMRRSDCATATGTLSRQGRSEGGRSRQRRNLEALSDTAVEEQVQIDQIMIDLDGTRTRAG
jgi:hypothetical protein